MRKIWTCIFLVFIYFFNFSSYCFSASNQDIGREYLEDSNSSPKTVYLTFDDGPGGKVTTDILDVLKKENVTATFFVIGNLAEQQQDIIKRMHLEGHAIGLHTYTHIGCKIYKNNDTFLQENLLTQELIENITGSKPSIVRFPFGCNNTHYKINDAMVESLHKNGIKIYDWNVDSTDGINPNMDPSRIAEKAKSKRKNAIVLMHCGTVNKNSAKALPLVIQYYKNQNYEFKTIDNTTPEIYRIKRN